MSSKTSLFMVQFFYLCQQQECLHERRRLDAAASVIDQHAFSISRTFGEDKTQERINNVGDLVRDLIGIGIFSKETIDSSSTENVIVFQAVGNSITFYVVSFTNKHFYTMLEFAHIVIPMSLSDLPSFLAQADKIMQIIACIDNIYSQEKKKIESSW
jgi:hypothetical protein